MNCKTVFGFRGTYWFQIFVLDRISEHPFSRFRCATIADARVFCDIAYERTPPEYFFDRNGENFSSILGKFVRMEQTAETGTRRTVMMIPDTVSLTLRTF